MLCRVMFNIHINMTIDININIIVASGSSMSPVGNKKLLHGMVV